MPSYQERPYTDRTRAESFGAAADRYDAARPSYPSALIDDILAGAPTAALDVGCGTGKLSRLLAARDLAVLGVEVDARMAAVARRHGIEVDVSAFEDWPDAGRRFDVLVSDQAWHWVDPERGAAKAQHVLVPGGQLWLCWNLGGPAEPMRPLLDEVYQRCAPELSDDPAAQGGRPREEIYLDRLRASGRFSGIETMEYPWTRRYPTVEYLRLLATHSDHATLPEPTRARLLDQVGAAIDLNGGAVTMAYRTWVVHARPVPVAG